MMQVNSAGRRLWTMAVIFGGRTAPELSTSMDATCLY